MTGEDHNSEAFIATLRSPALPAERAGETQAVSAMVGAQANASAASPVRRSRRGVAIAAVTVASLGLGGLAAAGPGIFSPAADQPDELPPPAVVALDETEAQTSDDVDDASSSGRSNGDAARSDEAGDVECAEGNHGNTVSSVAQAADPEGGKGDEVREAARSDCGKPNRSGGDVEETDEVDDETARSDEASDVECAEGNHGNTVSSVAQAADPEGGKGDEVREAARSDCGKTGEETAPGQSGEAPGQSGETPGQSGETPGQSGEAPGQGKAKNDKNSDD